MNFSLRPLSALTLLVIGLVGGWRGSYAAQAAASDKARTARIVVTTSMLGSAVADLAGDWCTITVLIPPQGCPGHFDLTPAMLKDLGAADLVLRHDYQGFLDDRLRGGAAAPGRLGVIPSGGSETLPEVYLALCRRVEERLSLVFPERAAGIQERDSLVERRVRAVSARERARARAALRGMPLLVASYQADFVTWAGGRVAALFERGEDLSLRQLRELTSKAKSAHVTGVVGNLQWGDREVRSLSEAMDVPGIVLSNYPESAAPGAWDRLLIANVSELASLSGDE